MQTKPKLVPHQQNNPKVKWKWISLKRSGRAVEKLASGLLRRYIPAVSALGAAWQNCPLMVAYFNGRGEGYNGAKEFTEKDLEELKIPKGIKEGKGQELIDNMTAYTHYCCIHCVCCSGWWGVSGHKRPIRQPYGPRSRYRWIAECTSRSQYRQG